MPDSPEVIQAKEKLRQLVVPAVETLEELVTSEHDGIRLGAAREILDRGGVPAKHETHVQLDIGLDDEIEQLLGNVRRQVEQRGKPTEFGDEIEDAVLVEEQPELPLGEQVRERIGVPPEAPEAVIVEPEPATAWWQAKPTQEVIDV